MSSTSSPRTYDSSHRQARARANQRAMIDAARARFLDAGYVATTLALVAEDAGVSVPTVYKVFGTKAGLLKAVFDIAVAGDDEPTPIADREIIHAIIREPDAATKLAMYMVHLVDAAERAVPVQLLARDAGAADPDAAEVFEQMRAEMLHGMALFAADLATTGQLTVDVDEARDLLWTFHGPELYELLVLQRGWTPARYAAFITRTLTTALLS